MSLPVFIARSRMAGVGIVMLLAFLLVAAFGSSIAPHDPWENFVPFESPSSIHPLGTNDVGQDIFSELLAGARMSLSVGALAGLLAVGFGVFVGIVAGFRRGVLDNFLMGLTDIVLVVPALPLVILLAAYLGSSMWNVVLVIGVVFWPSTARVVRSQVLTVRQSGYVESARALGAGDTWVMRRHVLPNVLPIVLSKFVLTVAAAMLMEASLSFLGLGDPMVKSWGMMLYYAFGRGGFIQGLWWWYLPPGLCIGVCILSLTLIGFAFETQSDPRLRRALER